MKKFKVTWILGGVFLVLIAIVYFVEIKGGKKRQEIKEQKEKLFVFDKKKVETITLSNENGVFEAKRVGDKAWSLVKPMEVPADTPSWNGILDTVYDFKPSRVIVEKADDIKPYGLEPPGITVSIKVSDKKEPHVLKLGDENLIGDSLFVTSGKTQKVTVGPKNVRYTLDKDLKALREKKLFKFNEQQTQEIEIKNKKSRLVLKREGEKWFVASVKEKKEADSVKVQALLKTLAGLEVSEFEDEAPKNLVRFGLQHPDFTVTVRDDKTTQLELLFGKKEENSVYVTKKSQQPVYSIRAYVLDDLSTDPEKVLKKPEKKKEKKTDK